MFFGAFFIFLPGLLIKLRLHCASSLVFSFWSLLKSPQSSVLMKTFTFNLDFIEELYSYGLVFAAGELFQFMSDELKKGNAVILVRSAKNNQPETSQTIVEKESLDSIHAAIRNSLPPVEQRPVAWCISVLEGCVSLKPIAVQYKYFNCKTIVGIGAKVFRLWVLSQDKHQPWHPSKLISTPLKDLLSTNKPQ